MKEGGEPLVELGKNVPGGREELLQIACIWNECIKRSKNKLV